MNINDAENDEENRIIVDKCIASFELISKYPKKWQIRYLSQSSTLLQTFEHPKFVFVTMLSELTCSQMKNDVEFLNPPFSSL